MTPAQCPFCNSNLSPVKQWNDGLIVWRNIKAFGQCNNKNCDAFGEHFARNENGVYAIPCDPKEALGLDAFRVCEFGRSEN